jgi:putative transposase
MQRTNRSQTGYCGSRITIATGALGFGISYLYLRNVKGFGWKQKRIYRIYKELELNLRIKLRKRLNREKLKSLTVPEEIN